MSIWRRFANRLSSAMRGKSMLRVLAPVVMLLLVAGCSRGLRQESWPGLMVTDGTVYAANLEQVQALNAETGKVYWGFPTTADPKVGPFYSTPVLAPEAGANGLLIVAGYTDHTVYALALGASATEVPDVTWQFTGAGNQYVGTGTIASGLFIIGNNDGKVYALSLADGSEVWSFTTRDRVWATPVVIDNTVYVASLDHHLYALDLQTGSMTWQLKTDGSISMTPAVVGGDLWFGDFSSKLYQVDAASGDILYTFNADNWLWATPIARDNILYFADVGGSVYALDTTTGSLVWNAPVSVDDVVHGEPALNPDGSLLFVAGYEKGQIHAINTATGTLQNWGTTPTNPGRLPGNLVTDGQRLYTQPILVTERVQAFDLVTGALAWSSPASAP